MLTTSNTPKYAYLRKVAVYPFFAITLILISFQLSSQKPKRKKEVAIQYTVTMRPDSTTFSDPKTGKKVFSVATRDMPPPPPPAGAPAPPTPPVPQAPLSTNSDKIYVVVEDITGGKPDEIVLVKTIESGNGTEKKISIDLKKEKPLIVIDGVITSDLDMNKINPSNIASMNVMKGEKAKEKYGEKGANGVVEITTKKP